MPYSSITGMAISVLHPGSLHVHALLCGVMENSITSLSFTNGRVVDKIILIRFYARSPRLLACELDQIVMAQGHAGLYTMCKPSAVMAPLCVVSVTHPDPTELSAYTPGVGLLNHCDIFISKDCLQPLA